MRGVLILFCFCALSAQAEVAPRIGEEASADAPFVPALPAATPEEALGRLRAAVAAHRDDAALGEAHDFLKHFPSSPEGEEVRLAEGALYLRRGNIKTAVDFLRPLARNKKSPLYGRAVHLFAGSLLSLGRKDEVLKIVPVSANGDRWLARAQIWRAAAARDLGRNDEALSSERAAADESVDSPVRAYALALLAEDLDRRGQLEAARAELTRAQAQADRWHVEELDESLTIAEGGLLAHAGHFQEAAAAYARFVEKHPDSPLLGQALYERGLALKSLNFRGPATASFKSLLRRLPDSVYVPDAHLQLGQIASEQGRLSEALQHYAAMSAAAKNPDTDRQALLLEARAYDGAGHWSQAVPLYRQFLKDEPDGAKAREVKGLLLVSLWRSNKNDPQIARLSAELPNHPLAPQIRWETAAAAYRNKDWANAERLFGAWSSAAPHGERTAESIFYRAEALRELGRIDEAQKEYEHFIKEAPRDPRARQAKARAAAIQMDLAYRAAADLGETDAGILAWESFAQRYPKHPKAAWAWWQAGRLWEKRKQMAAAEADYSKLRQARPREDMARLAGLLRLALLLELHDKPRKAVPLYIEITRYARRDNPAYETARRRLQALNADRFRRKRH